ncbi:hypothetical protein [Arthrobacter sp. Soil762]|uniref:hypothetical protein n=1 Tax=Arthrobacter sp. Soil762 TaxID=1736401 RepID=UPI000700BE8C|nr:hypothetical protein [Arthrobacter sp. Soil762]KRE80992.1 hypothetical protein ASG77_03445 [Arthrobacter sp. Soil762]
MARDRFLRRWVVSVMLAEAAGFAIPAMVGGILSLLAAPAGVVYPAMVLAGACEGVLLGFGQSIGLGPAIPRTPWILATAAGAAAAWSIGMLPSSLGGIDFGSPWMIVLTAVLGCVLLLSIPTLQWLVLRRQGVRSAFWIPVNAGAWAAGILWTLAPSPFIDETTPAPALFGVYLLAGLLMAATVAVLTGFAARRIASGAAQGGPVQP